MQTEEMLSLLEKQFVGWNRDGERGILWYLNTAQNILCNVEADEFMLYDEDTGKLPSFNTVDGVYSYDLLSNVNFVTRIVVEAGSNSSVMNSMWRQDYGNTIRGSSAPNRSIVISGVLYHIVPYVRTARKSESSLAKILFTTNPGSTVDIYRYIGYKVPMQVLSDTIQLTVPPPYDALYLYPATAMLMQAAQNNSYVEAYQSIETEFKPKLHNALNIGAFGSDPISENHGF